MSFALEHPDAPKSASEHGSAILSRCEVYRYELRRTWDYALGELVCLLVNPSKATADVTDHTIRKLVGFAARAGYGSIRVLNLYAFRATEIADLIAAWKRGIDVVGPDNRQHIEAALARAAQQRQPVLCAWGSRNKMPATAPILIECVYEHARAAGTKLVRLGEPTKSGDPCHPLTLGYATPFVEFLP